jgi:hypothetical protein
MYRLAVAFCAVALVELAAAQDRPLPDIEAFTARVKAHLATDDERQGGYTYVERATQTKVDGKGRTTDTSVKVFEVYPGLPGEVRYRRLVEENGRPVPPDKLASEDRVRQKNAESYARTVSSASGRTQETRRQDKDRRDLRAAIDDLFRVYDIRLVGRDPIDGRDAIVATATPRAGVKPMTDDGKMMQHFRARAWVNEADAEIACVEIEALDDLSFGWGLFARVHKGARAMYERRKINEEIWLPARVTWAGSARLFLVKRERVSGVSDFSNYRKFTVGTSTTYGVSPR